MPCPRGDAVRLQAHKQEAQRTDEIESLQNADFLSQHEFSDMFRTLLVAGATPMKKPSPSKQQTSPTSATDIKWQKKPTTLHGYKEAQATLYRLLRTMAYPNFSTTVDANELNDPALGTKLVQHLSNVILPVDDRSKDNCLEWSSSENLCAW